MTVLTPSDCLVRIRSHVLCCHVIRCCASACLGLVQRGTQLPTSPVRQEPQPPSHKALEDREASTFEKKRKLKEALSEGKAIPTEIRGEDKRLRKTLDLQDERTKDQRGTIDDEYAFVGVKDCDAWSPAQRQTWRNIELPLVPQEA